MPNPGLAAATFQMPCEEIEQTEPLQPERVAAPQAPTSKIPSMQVDD